SEDLIKKRLLFDGDGTGDDRRINVLFKKFSKWCTSDDSTANSKTTKEQILSLVGQCEYAFAKSRIVDAMSSFELKNYENLSKQITKNIENAKEEIIVTKKEFKEAKIVKKNRLEYEVLAKVIKDQPDRKETNLKLVNLQKELQSLEEQRGQLEAKFDMRRKQFHVLVSSLQQLQSFLNEADQNTVNITDVSLEPFDDDD
ncbi:hypothetical protein AAG570_010857, partial [Ranatra chinensis]